MNDETQDHQRRSSKDLIWLWLCWLGLAVLLYVLSIGPAMRMVQNRFIPLGSPIYEVLATFYWPMECSARKIPVLAHPIGVYLHLWAPRMFDRKGNRIG
jgi:hypothetical protein